MPSRRHPNTWTNWAGTVRCEVTNRAQPVTLEQVQAEVLRAAEEGERLRPVGAGRSFSPLCWSDENHLSLAKFTGIESTDVQTQRVWARAGTTLRRLSQALSDRGLALENAPDNDRLTLSGAISTASHGSGAAFGNLSTLITGLRMVCADGTVREIRPDTEPELFSAAAVSLGALGVITHVELQCVDDYKLVSSTASTTLGVSMARLNELRRDHRNAELFWFPYANSVIVRALDVTRDPKSWLSPVRHTLTQSLERRIYTTIAVAARRAPRTAERFGRMLTRRNNGRSDVVDARDAYPIRRFARFQAIEYALPIERLPAAIEALDKIIRALDFRMHFPIEVRFVKADALWLSPHSGRESACVAVPAYPDTPFEGYFSVVAEVLERHDGRPHWGMVHPHGYDELRAMYPHFDDFCTLRRELDPRGLFLNPHLAAVFGESLR
jgi:FAD-linked oxidoreductase